MSNYRRWRVEGGWYFFTVVTYERRPILTTEFGRRCLREAITQVRSRLPCEFFAFVLLPDHFHTVMHLPLGDSDYSTRMRQIKTLFTQKYLKNHPVVTTNPSRLRRSEQSIWQRRFYEHTILEEDDLRRCVDYIHINPVKHRLVTRVIDWPHSSFHRFVGLGEYASGWGGSDDWFGDEFKNWE
jgi:putative transposase